ncbi:MFS transporter [Deinococcus irradiatisoli]|uniref:MFS transporter n=2 Tax=Deinococcus irradiatisoli TaxID=2202254 RepID=A0A2Z3JT87_9DEIO|nr:MFS transporter [Deinococcus irradiatisoli]AWN24428.1 MFS transporter [Deinococcus irradiatisoli]
MWGGFFMVIPLITVHFGAGLGWSALSVGAVLGTRQLTQQGLTVFGGALSDRIGPRPLIALGLFTRALGFAAMGLSTTFPALLASAILAGVGGGLFDAPKNAAVTALSTPENRVRVFSLMSMAGNLGMVTGPLIGAALSNLAFRTVTLTSACAYLAALGILLLAVPKVPGTQSSGSGLGGLLTVARDRRFVLFTLTLSGYFILSTQINVAIALRAVELAGPTATGPLYALQAGLAVLLQYPVMLLAGRHFTSRQILMGGVTLAAAGLGSVALAHSFAGLLVCTGLFGLGAMTVFPTQQTLTARMAPPQLMGSYFGLGALSLGLGGALGSVLGGVLVDLGRRLSWPALPWLSFLLIGLLTVWGLSRSLPREERAAGER